MLRARALGLLAVLALPVSALAQQPARSSTVFSSSVPNGSLSVRVAVVLEDYAVRPLPLVPVVARRNDRADSVMARTDLDGRLSISLPAGAYTIRAFTPQRVGGRSYMWAVPVVIRASMTETVQLTNANAAVDSTVIAAAPAQPPTTNRQIVEAGTAGIDRARGVTPAQTAERDRAVSASPATMPAAPVAEGPAPSPPYVPVRALDSTPLRANTSRFFLGLSFNGSSIQFEEDDEIESGGGISALIGWGFTKNFALLLDLSGAAISTEIGDVGLGHAELAGRWHFANESRALVPFLEVGFAGRAVVQDDMLYYDDFGNPYSGDFSLSGTGVSFGGGLQYHITPSMAIGASLKWSVGDFTTVKLDNVSVDGLEMGATTARLNLGFTWYPVTGSLR
jgi:hypothetical protein